MKWIHKIISNVGHTISAHNKTNHKTSNLNEFISLEIFILIFPFSAWHKLSCSRLEIAFRFVGLYFYVSYCTFHFIIEINSYSHVMRIMLGKYVNEQNKKTHIKWKWRRSYDLNHNFINTNSYCIPRMKNNIKVKRYTLRGFSIAVSSEKISPDRISRKGITFESSSYYFAYLCYLS